MKRVLLLLCMALSLFSGIAVADQVVSSPGVVTAQPSPQPDMGSPLMAAAPPLTERICPEVIGCATMNPGYTPQPTTVARADTIGHYDTADPRSYSHKV